MADNRVQVADLAAPNRYKVQQVNVDPFVQPKQNIDAGRQLAELARALGTFGQGMNSLFGQVNDEYTHDQSGTGYEARMEAGKQGQPYMPPGMNAYEIAGWEKADAMERQTDYAAEAQLALQNSGVYNKENAAPQEIDAVLEPVRQKYLAMGKGSGGAWHQIMGAGMAAADHNITVQWAAHAAKLRTAKAQDSVLSAVSKYAIEWTARPDMTPEQVADGMKGYIDSLGKQYNLDNHTINALVAQGFVNVGTQMANDDELYQYVPRLIQSFDKYKAGTGPLAGIHSEVIDQINTAVHYAQINRENSGRSKQQQLRLQGEAMVDTYIHGLDPQKIKDMEYPPPDLVSKVVHQSGGLVSPQDVIDTWKSWREPLVAGNGQTARGDLIDIYNLMDNHKADPKVVQARVEAAFKNGEINEDQFTSLRKQVSKMRADRADPANGFSSSKEFTHALSTTSTSVDASITQIETNAKTGFNDWLANQSDELVKQKFETTRLTAARGVSGEFLPLSPEQSVVDPLADLDLSKVKASVMPMLAEKYSNDPLLSGQSWGDLTDSQKIEFEGKYAPQVVSAVQSKVQSMVDSHIADLKSDALKTARDKHKAHGDMTQALQTVDKDGHIRLDAANALWNNAPWLQQNAAEWGNFGAYREGAPVTNAVTGMLAGPARLLGYDAAAPIRDAIDSVKQVQVGLHGDYPGWTPDPKQYRPALWESARKMRSIMNSTEEYAKEWALKNGGTNSDGSTLKGNGATGVYSDQINSGKAMMFLQAMRALHQIHQTVGYESVDDVLSTPVGQIDWHTEPLFTKGRDWTPDNVWKIEQHLGISNDPEAMKEFQLVQRTLSEPQMAVYAKDLQDYMKTLPKGEYDPSGFFKALGEKTRKQEASR